ncbi:MAG: hypothetical protein RIB71_04765 [Imperialibacter sp.]
MEDRRPKQRRYDSAGISVGNRQTPERLGERRKLEDGKPKQASARWRRDQ